MRQWLRTVIGLACATGALGITVQAQSVDVRGGHGVEKAIERLTTDDMATWTSLSGHSLVKEDYGENTSSDYGQALGRWATGPTAYGTAEGAGDGAQGGSKLGDEGTSDDKTGADDGAGDKANDKSSDKAKPGDTSKSKDGDKDKSGEKSKAKSGDQSKDKAKSDDKSSDGDKKDDKGDEGDKKDKKSRFLTADQKKIDKAQETFDRLAGIEKPVDKVKDFDGFPAVKAYRWIKVEDRRRDEIEFLKRDMARRNAVAMVKEGLKDVEGMQEQEPLTYLMGSRFQSPDMDVTGLMYDSLDNALNLYGKDSKVISANGPYTVYDFPGGTFTSYRPELPNGTFETPYITSVHVVNHSFAIGHDVRVGSTRSQVLFAYGAPNAMYRRAKDSDEVLYLYVSPRLLTVDYKIVPEADGESVKDFTVKAVGAYGKYVPMSVLTPKYSGPLVKPTTEAGYLVFTFKKDRVVSIDGFRAQSFPWQSFPRLVLRDYPVGYVNGSDFRLMGHTVGDTFTGEPDVAWLSRGTYRGDSKQEAITYKDLVFVYDDKRKVNRIFVARSFNAMTPRGVTIGDSRNLMLVLYGPPSYPAYESKDGDSMMYVYMEAEHYNKYLVFTVDKKTGFISDIELTSEAPEQVIKMQNKKGRAKEEFVDILANPEKAKNGEL